MICYSKRAGWFSCYLYITPDSEFWSWKVTLWLPQTMFFRFESCQTSNKDWRWRLVQLEHRYLGLFSIHDYCPLGKTRFWPIVRAIVPFCDIFQVYWNSPSVHCSVDIGFSYESNSLTTVSLSSTIRVNYTTTNNSKSTVCVFSSR